VLPSFLLLQQSANPLMGFLPILLIFAIFYFLLFLPMQRQKKQQKKMLAELKNGDTVITSGGIVGTIVEIRNDDTLILRVKPGDTKLMMLRSSVSGMWAESGAIKQG
jgi:preprotein translocase subunit YajC